MPLIKKSVYDRRNLKHFGQSTPENCMDFTTIEPDVHIELVRNLSYDAEQKILFQRSFYSQMAQDCKFPEFIARKILNSNEPKAIWMRYFKQQSALDMAKVMQKYGPPPKEIEEKEKDSSAPIKKPMGLRARMAAKKQAADANASTKPVSGIRARMKLKQGLLDEDKEHERTLFVSNVPNHYDEDSVLAELDNLGYEMNIRRVNLVRNNGQFVGKAFIVMGTKEEADALKDLLHGTRWQYCVLDVQIALPKDNSE